MASPPPAVLAGPGDYSYVYDASPFPPFPPPPLRRFTDNRRMLKGGGGGRGANAATIWTNPTVGNFDDFGNAMLVLYIMSTGDAWDELMFATMDATSEGHGPIRNDFSAAAIFSILWMFVGCFFALNLFVGVIVDNFNKIKQESDGSATMTPEQQQWVDTMKNAANAVPTKMVRPPFHNPFRLFLYRVVT